MMIAVPTLIGSGNDRYSGGGFLGVWWCLVFGISRVVSGSPTQQFNSFPPLGHPTSLFGEFGGRENKGLYRGRTSTVVGNQ